MSGSRIVATTVLIGLAALALPRPRVEAQSCQVRQLPSQPSVVVDGVLDQSDCIVAPFRNAAGEQWTFSAQAGDLVIAQMLNEIPTSQRRVLDPYLILVDAAGNVLSTNDDAEQTAEARTAFAPIPATGTYTLIATTYVRSSSSAARRRCPSRRIHRSSR
jgi:hypothetical protein